MKVLLINGSPHEKGCTYTALKEIATELEKYQIEKTIIEKVPEIKEVRLANAD